MVVLTVAFYLVQFPLRYMNTYIVKPDELLERRELYEKKKLEIYMIQKNLYDLDEDL